jgi:hypothetical protein
MDKKHLTDRNQGLSDKLFAQQTDVELQRHVRSNNELKQQHEVLLSTLLLEQQLHTTTANEHKRLVKEVSKGKSTESWNPGILESCRIRQNLTESNGIQ